MDEPIVGAGVEETLAGAAVEEPLMGAEPLVSAAAEEELSDGVDTEEATEDASIEVPSAKKLLVLDVNGLLVATYHKAQKMPGDMHPFKLGNFYVYERPGCSEFLDFCFKNFVVGVWSSAREHNVTNLVHHIFKDLKEDLSFSWHQRHCTTTAVKHPDNDKKPIFLKELSKLWAEVDSGRFNQSNTLLIDDSPYKALKNPPHTAIFPQTYNGDEVDDTFLTLLRSYLEGLRDAPDVQEYVRNNPLGEPGISSESPLWDYFAPILNEGARELNLTAIDAVVNGATPAGAFAHQVQEFASQLNPEEIELEDMEQPAKRRHLSPVGVAGHSSRREPQDETAEQIHWRRNDGNDLENDKAHPRRNYERERERSPRMRVNHLDRRRFATSRERDTAEFAHHPRSNYMGDYNSRREDKSRGSWHDRPGVRDTSLSREPYGRRSSEHDLGRALPSQGGRQFITSGINIRDLPPPPVFSAPDPSRGLLPPPGLLPRTWDTAERSTMHYDNYGGRRHVSNVALSAPIEMPRSWEKNVLPGRGREYDRRWEDSVNSSADRGFARGWVRPLSSRRGSEFDRWEEPVSSGRGHDYERRWEEPVGSARGSEYDKRWKEPVGAGRGSEYDRRWREPVGAPREPVSAARERGFDSGWDRHASSSYGKEYDSRWGEPPPVANIGRGREYSTRWDDPVQSDFRKSDYERRWEQPLSTSSTRDYDSKWSKAPISQYAPPPPSRIDYSSQGYRNPSVDYKGRYPHADRNMAVAPRDDTRPYRWGASNNYRR